MRRIKIIIAVVALVILCGVGYWFVQKRNTQQFPSAFAQAPSAIFDVFYVDDGQLLLTEGYDGTNTLWSTSSKKKVGQFHCADRYVKVSDDGRQLLFIGTDLTFVQLPQDKSTFSDLQHQIKPKNWHVKGSLINISPDFSHLLINTASNELLLLDTKSRKVLARHQLSKKLNYLLSFSKDRQFIFSTKDPISKAPNHQTIYNASDLTVYRDFPELDKVFISDNGKFIFGVRLLTTSKDNNPTERSTLTIFNLETHKQIEIKTPFHFIYHVIQRPDRTIAVSGMLGNVSQKNTAVEVINYSVEGKLLNQVNVDFSRASSNDYLWIVKDSHSLKKSAQPMEYIMDTETGEVLHKLNVMSDAVGNECSSDSYYDRYLATISPNKSQIAYVNVDGLIRFYDFPYRGSQSVSYISNSSGQVLKSFDSEAFSNYDVSADGTVSIHRNIGLYQPQHKPAQALRTMHRNGFVYDCRKIILSPDKSKQLLFWYRNGEYTTKDKSISTSSRLINPFAIVELRNASSATLIKEFSSVLNPLSDAPGVAWSNDSSWVALSDQNGRIHVWNTETGTEVLYTSGTKTPYKQGGTLVPLLFRGSPSLAISPNKNYIAAGRADGTIYLYSLKTRLPVAQLGNAPSQPMYLKFSPDGKKIYGVTNHEVRAWKIPETLQ